MLWFIFVCLPDKVDATSVRELKSGKTGERACGVWILIAAAECQADVSGALFEGSDLSNSSFHAGRLEKALDFS